MVEVAESHYLSALKLLRILSSLLLGGLIAQIFFCLVSSFLINDSQAASMIADLVIQNLSYYFLGCAFLILSLGNILIKRGISSLRSARAPSLTLMLITVVSSYLLIPRMDYLRETALLDGMPVMLSPLANYFLILNSLTILTMVIQVGTSALLAWRLSKPPSST